MNPLVSGFDSPDLGESGGVAVRPRPRPGRRSFVISTEAYEVERLSGVGLDLQRVIDTEVEAIQAEARWCREHGETLDLDDLAIWENGRMLAVLRVTGEGKATVFQIGE
jgi:hypothetical protein